MIATRAKPNGTPRPAPIATSLLFAHDGSIEAGAELPVVAATVLTLEEVTVTVSVIEAVAAVTVVVASAPARSARGRRVALFQMRVFEVPEQQPDPLLTSPQHEKLSHR